MSDRNLAAFMRLLVIGLCLGGAGLAGAGLVSLGQWIGHAAAPTATIRAVVVSKTYFTSSDSRGNSGSAGYKVNVVTPTGEAIDVGVYHSSGAAQLDVGTPVILTRSDFDGQYLTVRSPTRTVDLENHLEAVVLRLGWIVFVPGGLWLAYRASLGRERWVAAGGVVAGALLFLALVVPRPDLAGGLSSRPNAMDGFGTSSTDDITRTTDASGSLKRAVLDVVGIGTPVDPGGALLSGEDRTFSFGSEITVTGPPLSGLPPGADAVTTSGFATLRIPMTARPGEAASPGALPQLRLIGDGVGVAIIENTCWGAPQALTPSRDAPRAGFACCAVPDGFVPRYLLVYNSLEGLGRNAVAIDLLS